MSRHTDAHTPRNGALVGDDLSDADLDALWEYFAGNGSDADIVHWWKDKPHQVAYRLLLRLTRAQVAK